MKKNSKNISRVIWGVPEELSRKPRESSLLYCPQAGRSKLQFETKEKADRYISWNSEEILKESGKAPIRSYWCGRCKCYHITSKLPGEHPDSHRKDLKEILQKVILEENPAEARILLETAEKTWKSGKGLWKVESRELLRTARGVVEKREYNKVFLEIKELLNSGNLSEAEVKLQWLESHNKFPDRTRELKRNISQG